MHGLEAELRVVGPELYRGPRPRTTAPLSIIGIQLTGFWESRVEAR